MAKIISSTAVKAEPKPRPTPKTDGKKYIGNFELLNDEGGYYFLKPSLMGSGSMIRHAVPYETGRAISMQKDSPITVTNY